MPRSVRPVRSRTVSPTLLAQRPRARRRRPACRSASRGSRPAGRRAGSSAASSAKWLGGQRLAGPNSAPGHRIDDGPVGLEVERAHRRRAIGDVGHQHGRWRHRHAARRGGAGERGEAVDEPRHAPCGRAGAHRSAGPSALRRGSRCAAECARGTGPARTSTSWAARTRAYSLRLRSSRASVRRARRSNLPWPNGVSMIRRMPRMRA